MAPTVCHLCDFVPAVPGTFLDSLLRLAAAARERLGARNLFVFPEAAATRPWRPRVEAAGKCIFAPPGAARRHLEAELGEGQPVILHSHFVGYDGLAFLLKLELGARRRARLILHLHSYPEHMSWAQHTKDLVKIRLVGRWLCDRAIAVSRSVESRARARGFAPDRLVLIENAIDLERFAPAADRRAAARARLGLDGAAPVALLLGRDPLLKGADLYLEAARTIVEAGGDGLFCLVGRDETRAFARQQPALGDRLRLLEPVADFPELLSAVDVFVSASRREGLPYAILEAMASERLVIASEIEGAGDSYGRAAGVWLFPIGRADRLAELLGRALELDAGERQALGRANRAFAQAHFALDPWASRIVACYEEALAG